MASVSENIPSDSELKYEFMSGVRKDSKLLHTLDENHVYRKKNKYLTKVRYACYMDNCPVSVGIDLEGKCCYTSKETQHNHDIPTDFIMKMKHMKNIKEKCANASLERSGIREIFDEECRNNKDVLFSQVRRTLCKIKAANLPKNPTCPSNIKSAFEGSNIMMQFGKSKYTENADFYRGTIIEDAFSYAVFASPSICQIIETNDSERHYSLDATFSVLPNCGFQQLLIIYYQYMDHVSVSYVCNVSTLVCSRQILQMGLIFCGLVFYKLIIYELQICSSYIINCYFQMFPFIYVLMTNKSKEIYQDLFLYINQNIFAFNGTTFHTDYEMALRMALQIVFPDSRLKGCWFHFCQALKRKSAKISNFSKLMKQSQTIRTWYLKFLALPLVKPAEIRSMFEILINEVKEMPEEHLSILQQFADYFENYWMKKITPEKFSVCGENTRTTSALEGYNSQLSCKLAKHGNFYKFLNCILNEDFATSVTLKNAVDGLYNIFQPPKTKNKLKYKKISKLTEDLYNKKISLKDFFNQITNLKNNICDADKDIKMNHSDRESSDEENDQENINEKEDLSKCAICFENAREILLQPCNHFKICQECLEKLSEQAASKGNSLLCPFCRTIVQNSAKVFL